MAVIDLKTRAKECQLRAPTRQLEHWRYAWRFFKDNWTEVAESAEPIARLSNIHAPTGVILMTLADAIDANPKKWSEKFDALLSYIADNKKPQPFLAQLLQQLQAAIVVSVPAGQHITGPVVIRSSDDEAIMNVMIYIDLAEEASVDLFFQDNQKNTGLFNRLVVADFAPKAACQCYTLQTMGKEAKQLTHYIVDQADDSVCGFYQVQLGGKAVRDEIDVRQRGVRAKTQLHYLSVLDHAQYADVHMTAHHQADVGYSDQQVKALVADQATFVFNGSASVAPQVKDIEAHQHNDNLLLSNQATVNTKPELVVYAESVLCSHGARVGNLTEEAVFYLMSRGLSREQAQALLMQGFAYAVLDQCPRVDIRQLSEAAVLEKLTQLEVAYAE